MYRKTAPIKVKFRANFFLQLFIKSRFSIPRTFQNIHKKLLIYKSLLVFLSSFLCFRYLLVWISILVKINEKHTVRLTTVFFRQYQCHKTYIVPYIHILYKALTCELSNWPWWWRRYIQWKWKKENCPI